MSVDRTRSCCCSYSKSSEFCVCVCVNELSSGTYVSSDLYCVLCSYEQRSCECQSARSADNFWCYLCTFCCFIYNRFRGLNLVEGGWIVVRAAFEMVVA